LENQEVSYFSYQNTGSSFKSVIGRIMMGSAFIYFALSFPNFFFKLIFGFLAFSLLAQPITDFIKKQVFSIDVFDSGIKLALGFAGHRNIFLKREDIVGIDVIEGHSRKSRRDRKRQYVRSKIIYRKGKMAHDYTDDAVCIIHTRDGKSFEIEKRFLAGFEFEKMMSVIDDLYHDALPKPEANSSIEIKSGLQLSEEERKIDALIKKNRTFRDEDFILKAKFIEKLNEAYKTIYNLRPAREAVNMPEDTVIYTASDAGRETFFIFHNDFKTKLSQENIEIGLQLINAAQKNLKLVEVRINSYAKIEEKLSDLKFQEESRRKLQNLTKDLENLQNKNTQNSTESDIIFGENAAYEDNLNELADLTQSVHRLEDLEKAVELNEHISFFTDKKQ
jgi:hypothetical protein